MLPPRSPRSTALLGAVTLLAALAGCAPTPAPTPTPTPAFASDAEAFAAAEEVYRAYVAESAQRASGVADADPQRHLRGQALEADIDAQRALGQAGLTVVGESTVRDFAGVSAELATGDADIRADVCIDISTSRVIDSEGVDRTPPDRPSTGGLRVRFLGTAKALSIVESSPAEVEQC